MFEKAKKWAEDHEKGLKIAGVAALGVVASASAFVAGYRLCRLREPYGLIGRAYGKGRKEDWLRTLSHMFVHGRGGTFTVTCGEGVELSEATKELLECAKEVPFGGNNVSGLIAFVRKE